ncbi:MAG TPA: hypothetical protein VGX78_04580 [Pirellulales bacterium]|jgi:hypothetical protein|nr:hypothetical protein [Pirellulales bacterium]
MTASNENHPQTQPGGESHADQAVAVPAGKAAFDARIGLVCNRWVMLAAALAAGTCIGAILHFGHPFFRGPTVPPPINHDPVAGGHTPMHATLRRVEYQNAAAVYGLFGAAVSAALALAEGTARKSAVYAGAGMASGIVFGGGLGIVGGLVAQCIAFQPTPGLDEMAKTILMRGPSWAVAGMGIGLGFTLPSRCWRTIAMGTGNLVLGGLLSALVFGPAVAVVLPRVQTELVVPPASADRVAWLVATAGLMGLLAGRRGRQHPGVPKAASG